MINRAIILIYNSIKHRTDMTLEQFAEALKDWNFVELENNDKLFGVIMIKGNELHISLDGIPKFSIRRYLKETIGKVIQNYGYAVTTVTKGNEKGLNFCKRFGFVVVNEDQSKIYMKCDRCKYV
jgi:hypothetical protein